MYNAVSITSNTSINNTTMRPSESMQAFQVSNQNTFSMPHGAMLPPKRQRRFSCRVTHQSSPMPCFRVSSCRSDDHLPSFVCFHPSSVQTQLFPPLTGCNNIGLTTVLPYTSSHSDPPLSRAIIPKSRWNTGIACAEL
jgi:hypothetical protein